MIAVDFFCARSTDAVDVNKLIPRSVWGLTLSSYVSLQQAQGELE